ncbi:MAG TPA: homoserine dehydrogenase, partial [Candidatus Dormibacteraeota bacterium]|nr:homoserine dehydrogenase [Candidatus Dormibacteraeota bacterium]
MRLTVGVALLGCGTVGASVADRLQRERDAIERRSGVRYELRAIAIRDLQKRRPDSLDRRIFTRDARSIVDDPSVDLVVELIGGATDAADLVERALERGRHVVTANKDLLATQGPRLHALAASRGAALRFEGAVGGAVPVVRTLEHALAGDEVLSVAGVVNGSSTSILSAMERGAGFGEALARAQHLGYAEADPSNDIEGTDAAHKLALVIQLAFGLAVVSPRIRRAGIATISQRDVARAQMLGLRIRLVAATVRTANGIAAEVAPLLLPQDHEFARTEQAENVVEIVARDAGRLVLRGSGAGGPATASAVLGDVVGVLRQLGGRHDVTLRGRAASLEPAIVVDPL